MHLWNYISINAMWSTVEEKAFALYYIAIDVRSPYYNVGVGLKMSDDDYSKIQEEIFEALENSFLLLRWIFLKEQRKHLWF